MEIIELNGKKYQEIVAQPQKILAPGNKVFIRTLTYHTVGLIREVTDTEVVLEQASWVADSGRWNLALREGKLSEVEPCPQGDIMGINRANIVDYFPWRHDLPTEVK